MIGPGWFTCCVGKKYTKTTGQFVMPGRTAGQPMPGFLGGSILAVPVGADKTLGADWIKAYTSNASMTALRAIGNIPNTTSLLGTSVNERAAARSWFVPTSKNWVERRERQHPPQHARQQILTGKLTVKQAAESASDNITRSSTPTSTGCGTGDALRPDPVPHPTTAVAAAPPLRARRRRPLSVGGVARGTSRTSSSRPSSSRSARSSATRSTTSSRSRSSATAYRS